MKEGVAVATVRRRLRCPVDDDTALRRGDAGCCGALSLGVPRAPPGVDKLGTNSRRTAAQRYRHGSLWGAAIPSLSVRESARAAPTLCSLLQENKSRGKKKDSRVVSKQGSCVTGVVPPTGHTSGGASVTAHTLPTPGATPPALTAVAPWDAPFTNKSHEHTRIYPNRKHPPRGEGSGVGEPKQATHTQKEKHAEPYPSTNSTIN
ncbi:hypothetical protein TcG_07541 [Trypanosoma cruzi]|nr:hypothetical protein TcG_07541 [Trypanosoma cruzi]